jgi:iron-sulfur cluster assembly accessory protein
MTQSETKVFDINLTENAAQAVQDLLVKQNLEGYALRVFVSGGGCQGYQYGMSLEESPRDDDRVKEFHGVKLVVDSISVNYLNGASIDYVEGVMESGFKIDNPNAVSSCGCGNSFQAAGEERPENHNCNC